VAAALQQELGLASELVVGRPGELSVWLGDKKVAEKQGMAFPDPAAVVAAVRAQQG
jgi:hypothetical protein